MSFRVPLDAGQQRVTVRPSPVCTAVGTAVCRVLLALLYPARRYASMTEDKRVR